MIATSLIDLHIAATIRLKLIMDKQVRKAINRINHSVPGIRVYPNPSNGILYLEGSLDQQKTGMIQLFDLRGQMVLKKAFSSSGSFRESLQVQHLSSGSYLVVVRGDDGTILQRKQVIIDP